MGMEDLCSNEEVDRRILKFAEIGRKLPAGKKLGLSIDKEPGNAERYKDALARLAPEFQITYEGDCEVPGVTLLQLVRSQ